MSAWKKWCARLGAAAGAAVLTLFVPAIAWASTGPGSIAVEAARRRYYRGGGFLSGFCCLLVVAVIVLIVVLITRNRSGRR